MDLSHSLSRHPAPPPMRIGGAFRAASFSLLLGAYASCIVFWLCPRAFVSVTLSGSSCVAFACYTPHVWPSTCWSTSYQSAASRHVFPIIIQIWSTAIYASIDPYACASAAVYTCSSSASSTTSPSRLAILALNEGEFMAARSSCLCTAARACAYHFLD